MQFLHTSQIRIGDMSVAFVGSVCWFFFFLEVPVVFLWCASRGLDFYAIGPVRHCENHVLIHQHHNSLAQWESAWNMQFLKWIFFNFGEWKIPCNIFIVFTTSWMTSPLGYNVAFGYSFLCLSSRSTLSRRFGCRSNGNALCRWDSCVLTDPKYETNCHNDALYCCPNRWKCQVLGLVL